MAFDMTDQKKTKPPKALSMREQFAHDTLQLKQATWADERLAKIETEDLAIEAYLLSDPLKREFGGEHGQEAYLAYWRNLRKGNINGGRQHK